MVYIKDEYWGEEENSNPKGYWMTLLWSCTNDQNIWDWVNWNGYIRLEETVIFNISF